MASSIPPLEAHITCSVCLEVYTDPRALPCLHTYCHACIEQVTERGQVRCPDCRQVTHTKDIKKNFSMQSLVELQEQSAPQMPSRTVCSVCHKGEKATQSFCGECEEFLCVDCHLAHQGSKTSSTHTLTPIQELCRPKQREVRAHIERLQLEKVDVSWRREKHWEVIQQIHTQHSQQADAITQHREHIKVQADRHHNQLLHQVSCITQTLLSTAHTHTQLYHRASQELDHKIDSLTTVSHSEDYSLLTDTLASLSQDLDRGLEKLRSDLPAPNTPLTYPVTLERGQEWDPTQNLRVHLHPQTLPPRRASLHKQYRPVRSVDIDFWPRKLCLINGELWVAGGHKGVYVYSLDCQPITSVSCKQFTVVTALTHPSGSDVIVSDRNTGLHRINLKGEYLSRISDGSFSDVSSFGDCVYALDYRKCEVLIFSRQTEGNTWVKQKEFRLQYSNGHVSDQMCVTGAAVYISSFDNHRLYAHSLQGEFWLHTGECGETNPGMFRNPHLCDIKCPDRVLVCDWRNHRLQVLDTLTQQWCVLDLQGEARYPVSAGLGTEYIWVGSAPSLFGARKLIQYKPTEVLQ